MSKLLNTFITKEHLPLKKFKHDVIEILFDKNEDLTDEEIYARLRILKRTYEDVLEGKKDMTHWALQNIS
tara:strand:- start:31788 stop:31997 length:210 start_codon:yes stop_codon:yes gene_type:complete